MWPLSILLLLIINLSEYDLFISISDLTKSLNQLCLNFTPKSIYSNIYEALICGKRLSSHELTHNLKNIGIYHVMIVSGSHLVFLSLIIENLFKFKAFQKLKVASFLILITYSLATGSQAPVMRALISIIIGEIQSRKKLFWSDFDVTFISLLVALALFDPWIKSYSLLLSYAASLALNLASKKNFFIKNLYIYFLILPFLIPLSAPHLLSFLSNMTLTPFIGTVLFPLSFLSFFIPFFYKFVDPIWSLTLTFCYWIGPMLDSMTRIEIPIRYLWVLAIAFNLYGIVKSKRCYRWHY